MRLNDRELRIAYEQSLSLTRHLGRLMKDRAVERILPAIAIPCGDIHPDYAAQTHCVALPDDDGIHDDPPSRPL